VDERTAVRDLVERLGAWVEQQPEYPYLFLADRQRRKRAATIVAHRLLILPAVPAGKANRKVKRGATKNVQRQIGGFRTSISRRRERMLTKALRDQRRYRRLSYERSWELALRENSARDALAAAIAAEAEAAQANEPQED
jgi:hypothetical protein